MDNLGRSLLFALIGVVFMLPMASAGLVGVYLNDSEDLVTIPDHEESMTLPYGENFILAFHVGGPYRIDSGDDNFSAYSINVDVHFLSDVDRRDTCTMCAIPNLKPLGDTDNLVPNPIESSQERQFLHYYCLFHHERSIDQDNGAPIVQIFL